MRLSLLRDIKAIVLFVEHNHPNRPIFLAGHHISASIILNYATWSEAKAPSGGFIFTSLLSEMNEDFTDPGNYMNWTNLLKLIEIEKESKERKSGIFSMFQRSPAKVASSPMTWRKDVQPYLEYGHYNYLGQDILKACLPFDFLGQLKQIKSPFCFLAGEKDEIVFAPKMIQDIRNAIKPDIFTASNNDLKWIPIISIFCR